MPKFTPNQYAAAYLELALPAPNEKREQLALRLVKNLAYKRQLKLLPRIISALENLIAKRGGPLVINFQTATKLGTSADKEISQQLKKISGREIKLRHQTNPKLLAGAKLKIDDRLIDNSLSSRLQSLKSHLLTNV
ncbi:hypothetical protein C4546_02300 [Candidatus Parcubacteria bacterium]|jgi:F-type H+-transporting ATPase subunit delta|nr:MAG: hypothetical protein C4546_02300 [Candidatus Parcubacteria bacterium]